MKRTFDIPDELYEMLKKYADENYISVTTVLKMAIKEYLDNHKINIK